MKDSKDNGVTITKEDAEEFALFKRERALKKVKADVRKCVLEINGCCERVKSLLLKGKEYGVSSVKIRPAHLLLAKEQLKSSPVLIDCIVGGQGETLEKVKVYETKIALKNGAKEVSLVLDDERVRSGDITSLKREIKGVKRAFRGGSVKLYTNLTDKENLFRLSKLAAVTGVWFISAPYTDELSSFQEELHGNCFVEFRGVDDPVLYKDLIERGVMRIATSQMEKIYGAFLSKLPPLSSVENAQEPTFTSVAL